MNCPDCKLNEAELQIVCEFCGHREAAPSFTVDSIVRLPRPVLEALEAASEALEDLGACDDPKCNDENCNHALIKVRDVLTEQ